MAERIVPEYANQVHSHEDCCYEHLIAVVRRGNRLGELWRPVGVAIDSTTNRIYVVEDRDDSSRVSIFSETGEFLNTFRHEDMRHPSGIAIYRESIYVTNAKEHFVFHFRVAADIHLIARLGGKESDIEQFKDPMQMTVSSIGDLFFTDHCKDRIQITDSSLQYQRSISHHSMSKPCDIKLTPNEVYVLSDRDNPCVHVFTYTGEKIRSLITHGIGLQVTNPTFLCLDTNNNLFVSDLLKVRIFSKVGTLLHTLGGQGQEVGKFGYLGGIVQTNNLKLVVVSWNTNYRLQIFSFQ